MVPDWSVMTITVGLCSTALQSWRNCTSACLRSLMSSTVARV
jgi:hypothetical protein